MKADISTWRDDYWYLRSQGFGILRSALIALRRLRWSAKVGKVHKARAINNADRLNDLQPGDFE